MSSLSVDFYSLEVTLIPQDWLSKRALIFCRKCFNTGHISDYPLRASYLMLEIKEFRCYEAKIEESDKGSQLPGVEPSGVPLPWCLVAWCPVGVEPSGCPVAVAQWQSTSGSSQRCPGFDSRWLPAFFTFLYFCLITFKFL